MSVANKQTDKKVFEINKVWNFSLGIPIIIILHMPDILRTPLEYTKIVDNAQVTSTNGLYDSPPYEHNI